MAAQGFTETLNSFFNGNPLSNLSPAKVLNFSTLDPRVSKHLQKVYATLTMSVVVAAIGAYVGMTSQIAMNSSWLIQLASFGCMIALGFTPAQPHNLHKRYAFLGAISFAQGMALAPLLLVAAAVNPSIIFTSLLATSAVFGCFTLASLLTPRRSFMYLGGYLASAITTFMVLRLVSWLLPGMSKFAYGLELYGGLLVFSGYVLFDTQLVVEKAYAGDFDHVAHALGLLLDLIHILVRVIIIMIKNQQKRDEAERKRRDSKSSRRD